MRDCTCFHSITPILGTNISATAATATDDESKECSFRSVAQKPRRMTERTRSLIWSFVIGPSSDLRLPEAAMLMLASAAVGAIIFINRKYMATLIAIENGAPTISQSIHAILTWIVRSISAFT